MTRIFPAETDEHYQHVRDLTAEYYAWDVSKTAELGLDSDVLIGFQYGHGHEALPGEYAPPTGCLLLATHDSNVAACGAYHRLASDICEMKRVYVRPPFRGFGIGRQLTTTLISNAKHGGYGLMRLETVTFMGAAISLYESLGFRPCELYYVIPESFHPITVFMELDLRRS